MLERQTEADKIRLESQQDHEETLQQYKAEMQNKMDQESRELESKIGSENRQQQELMMNWHMKEAARLEARVRQMQNNMDRKVEVTLNNDNILGNNWNLTINLFRTLRCKG